MCIHWTSKIFDKAQSFCLRIFNVDLCCFSSAELMERLSDYVDCTPSLLSLPHPITPSPSTEAIPTQDSCMASDGDQLRDSETESSDLINAPSPSVSIVRCIQRLKLLLGIGHAANDAFFFIS